MNRRKLEKAVKRLKNLPRNQYLLLYAINKIRHFFYRLIKTTKVAFPSTIMLELNNHCNLKCTTCPREYDFGKEMDKGFIGPDEAKKIIDELWPYLDSIGLTGMGETFLYKDINQIIEYIKEKNKGIIVSLSTNAMLPNFIERVENIIGKADTIQVSIDGLDDVYEAIRINASFKILNENLIRLVELCEGTETKIMLNMVVTKENYLHMNSLIEYCNKIGVKYLNFTLFNLSSVTNLDISYYDFFQTEEFLTEMRKVENQRKSNNRIEITNWDFKTKNEFQKCFFPWTHFYICWNGFVTPCCAKPFPKELNFGNVFDKGVMNILNSNSFREFRELWFKNITPDFCDKCHFVDLEPINNV
jgi:radical SAM protein with 4Fe4S-binding SPASM domain